MKILYLGLGEKLDIFFAMENGEITRIFYNEGKCVSYINNENDRREYERKSLFD